jgi:prepilin-type N-terminal cleavage/methylation domain-containing protein
VTRHPSRARGFTLLEVMIALAILASALVVLLEISSQDVRAAYRAKLITIATGLSRSKMYDLEADLVKNGFADSPETENGDFTEEGQPKFKWEATFEKVELPASDALSSDATKPGQPLGSGDSKTATDSKDTDALMNLAGGSSSGALGASMVQMYLPLIGPIISDAIRKVTLTVKWKVGDTEESIKTICFFTDTKAIDLALQGMALASGTSTSTSTPPATPPTNQTPPKK